MSKISLHIENETTRSWDCGGVLTRGLPYAALRLQCRVFRPVLRRLVPRCPVLCRQPGGVWFGLAYRGAAPHYATLVWGYRGVASSRLKVSKAAFVKKRKKDRLAVSNYTDCLSFNIVKSWFSELTGCRCLQ